MTNKNAKENSKSKERDKLLNQINNFEQKIKELKNQLQLQNEIHLK